MLIKIKNEELVKELIGEIKDFPLYATQLINLANQNAQGTRPRVVGQLTEFIKECPERTYEGWKKWYLLKYPNAIESATERINEMMDKLKEAIKSIDESMIKKWVEDLVLEKTFVGLRFQEAILKKVASIKNSNYRLAEPKEESQGIDGFIGDVAVSIKPITYKTKDALREEIKAKIIFYNKTKSGLEIDADNVLK
ncbi:MAG: restriction endonuclease [Candidatus Nealsonbacteria bacterium RBG_13_37_56]|uniref:Restriction endonuclease n=1 Tax=Candidatus Nealsonbacteria bacterium RBG_13_37_56 TaxID=1801661 RepID=A0A1G2DZ97_9BACT|nr:MAG: restriction endonuclease [Candidatus Nealsonbacteria bacterium RBG_13_37_56]